MQAIYGLTREKLTSILAIRTKNPQGREFHFHSQIEIAVVNEGRIESWVGDKKYSASAGEILVALSFEPHIHETKETSDVTFAFLPLHLSDEFTEAIRGKRAIDPVLHSEEAYRIISAALFQLEREDLNPIEKKGYVGVVLGSLLRYLPLGERETDNDPTLTSSLLYYINTNYKSDITPESLAAKFGYTKDYISSHFRSSFKTGIKKYLNSVRLRNALMLIEEGRLNFTECALEAGFSSIRTFYRVFKTELKCTPKEYFSSQRGDSAR